MKETCTTCPHSPISRLLINSEYYFFFFLILLFFSFLFFVCVGATCLFSLSLLPSSCYSGLCYNVPPPSSPTTFKSISIPLVYFLSDFRTQENDIFPSPKTHLTAGFSSLLSSRMLTQ